MGGFPDGAQALGIVVLGAALLVLSAWLPVVAARRWVPPAWRPFAAGAGAAAILAVGLCLAVVSFTSLAAS